MISNLSFIDNAASSDIKNLLTMFVFIDAKITIVVICVYQKEKHLYALVQLVSDYQLMG